MGTNVKRSSNPCKFQPHASELCLATVHGGRTIDKTRFVMDWLKDWLKFYADPRVAPLPTSNYVVVFDIDDTLVDDAQNKIQPVVGAYRLALALKYKCAIVTARPEIDDNRSVTESMLRTRGIDSWESLYMMPADVAKSIETISVYKKRARMHIAERYDIIANVGDMWHDHVVFPLNRRTDIIHNFRPKTCAVMFVGGAASIKLVADP